MSSLFTKLIATPLRPNLPERPILKVAGENVKELLFSFLALVLTNRAIKKKMAQIRDLSFSSMTLTKNFPFIRAFIFNLINH